MSEYQDNGKTTVDLVWSTRPHKKNNGTFQTLIPQILVDIGPEEPIDFHVSWEFENNHPAGNQETTSVASSQGSRAIIEQNKARREEENFSTDNERISKKVLDGIDSLIGVRKLIHTSRGALRLLIEILRLSVRQDDRASAYDLLWAIESTEALKDYETELRAAHGSSVGIAEGGGGVVNDDSEERYKALVNEAKKMKQAQLAKECEKRGLEKKGSKDDLLARLRIAYKEEAKASAIPEASGGGGKDKKDQDEKESKKKDKEDKKKDSGNASGGGSEFKPSTAEGALIDDAYELILKVRKWRSDEPDMIKKQLTDMSHLLPPLSPFTNKFKLDDWQKRVLQLIDEEKSILICAPTSSGKTVLSSYVASRSRRSLNSSSGSRVLFVVPSDPLVWQVGAHFAKWQGLDRNVALITDRLSYAPQVEQLKPAAVVVGTPLALENALTKMRGSLGSLTYGDKDQQQLIGGFDHYDWVVYDEVHSIGSSTPDGMALQRLIKSMKCNFLALSATVGNADQLRSWMETVRGEQVTAEAVTADPEVKMEIHEGRFINLQRHLWSPIRKGATKIDGTIATHDGELDLVPLHPLSAVSFDFLTEGGFSNTSLPMTPQDSFSLWESMMKFYDMSVIAHLDPHTYFQGRERITLLKTKDYESYMKKGLEELAESHPAQTKQLLESFNVSDMKPEFSLYSLIRKLRVEDSAGNNKLPCIVFHLDISHLIGRFKELLYGLERDQREAYPAYYAGLEGRRRMAGAEREAALRACATEEEKEELMKDSEALSTVDTEQPHPDFVMNARAPISRTEFENVLKDVAENDFQRDKTAAKNHPLMRALRRGIGLYIDEIAFQAYKRAVMRLATKGKLAVVFSDESLAFGVNMPFRTCVFCGDMGGRLNSTLVQQMSGRAGRRGLDTQGHLVYAGAQSEFVRKMVISYIPALKGEDPRYLTMFLQSFSQFVNPHTYNTQTDVLGCTPLTEHVNPTTAFNMTDISRNLMLELKFVEECDVCTEEAAEAFDYRVESFDYDATPSGYRPRAPYNIAALWMIWDLRDHIADSVVLGKFLPLLYKDFAVGRPKNYGEIEDVQFEFVATLLHIIDRRPAIPDSKMIMSDDPFISSTTVVKRQELRNRIEWINEEVRAHNAHIRNLASSGQYPHIEKLLVPVDEEGAQLDGTLLHCFITGVTDDVPVHQKHEIKERLWELGCTIRAMHNSLWPDFGKYGKLETLTRKCFTRIQYIAGDHIKDNINFTNISAYELEGENVQQISEQIETSINYALQMTVNGACSSNSDNYRSCDRASTEFLETELLYSVDETVILKIEEVTAKVEAEVMLNCLRATAENLPIISDKGEVAWQAENSD